MNHILILLTDIAKEHWYSSMLLTKNTIIVLQVRMFIYITNSLFPMHRHILRRLNCFEKYVDVILSDITGYRYKIWWIYQFLIHIQIQIFYWLTKRDRLKQQYKQKLKHTRIQKRQQHKEFLMIRSEAFVSSVIL